MTCGCFHDAIPGYFVLRYVHAAFARAPLRRAAIAYRQTTRFAAARLHDKTYLAPTGRRRRRRPRRLRQLGYAAPPPDRETIREGKRVCGRLNPGCRSLTKNTTSMQKDSTS